MPNIYSFAFLRHTVNAHEEKKLFKALPYLQRGQNLVYIQVQLKQNFQLKNFCNLLSILEMYTKASQTDMISVVLHNSP